MSQYDRIANVFGDGPVDLRKPAKGDYQSWQVGRLLDQAYYLGRCANLVYPRVRDPNGAERLKRLQAWTKRWEGLPWEECPEDDDEQGESDSFSKALKLGRSLFQDAQGLQEGLHADLENDLDDMTSWLRKVYRKTLFRKYVSPRGWFSKQRLKEVNQAKRQCLVAHDLWMEETKKRILEESDVVKACESNEGNVEFASEDGTEYFLAADKKFIILCFRGTQPHKVEDVLTDLVAWQTSEAEGGAKFHSGFWGALDGIWENLKKSLETDLHANGFRNTAAADSQKLWITGHSLGGALATLAAYRIARERYQNPESPLPEIGGVFTFGQPRVGDSQFASEYRQLVCNRRKDSEGGDPAVHLNDRHFRFVNNNDVVTVVPPKPLCYASMVVGRPLTAVSSKGNGAPESTAEPAEGLNVTVNSDQPWSIEYSDVGRVVLANRAELLKLLTPDESLGGKFWKSDFWWPVPYRLRRVGSWRLFSLRPCGGFTKRFLPGISDHSMPGYVRVLELACGHHAFVQVALKSMEDAVDDHTGNQTINHAKRERGFLKLGRRAWKTFGQERFEVILSDREVEHRDPKHAGDEAWVASVEERDGVISEACRRYGD